MDCDKPTAVDIAFVVDATGSMGDEMTYLKSELEDIVTNIAAVRPNVNMRFALILYRDIGDSYVIRTFDFTDNLNDFLDDLRAQVASGGGDYPEAAEQALAEMHQLTWRSGNVARVAFFVADAPPHDNNAGVFVTHANTARTSGIRIYPVAASGVADLAEYLMRTAAELTLGRYIFLTDDSGIGGGHAEPHIPCFHVQFLNGLMTRVLLTELTGARVEPTEDDIIATVGHPVDGVCQEQ
ncbi:MAG: VWA domain-containing protein [Candidatus Hydrogenedentes bacterium]|nr:VWA domain-containing protein [Candidatus Hydrogenedentota bacterium]